MLHRFAFGDGRVSYANRFLRTRAFEAAERDGRIGYREFATDPCRSAFRRVASLFDPKLTDNGAVNVTRLGDEYLALTETPLPVAFDPETLETLGVRGEPPADIATAHPHHDAGRGELVGHGTSSGPRSSLRPLREARRRATSAWSRGSRARPPRLPALVRPDRRHVVLHEGPFVVNPLKLALSGRPFIENFRWEPERGSRFWVIDRADGGARWGRGRRRRRSASTTSTASRRTASWSSTCSPSRTRRSSGRSALGRLRAGERPPYPSCGATAFRSAAGRRRSSP